MVKPGLRKHGDHDEKRIQIPLFYKMMVSMLFVSMVPLLLLGIVAVGGIREICTAFGIGGTIILLTVITITAILISSYYLSRIIAGPIVQLSQIAEHLSRGVIPAPELPVTRNDEIGTLSRAFLRMVNTFCLLDTLARDQQVEQSRNYLKE